MNQDLSSEQLHRLMEQEKVFLLDVRSPETFNQGHVEVKSPSSLINIPYFDLLKDPQASLTELIKNDTEHQLPKNENIIVVCARGRSAKSVADALRTLGYQASILIGGMQSWRDLDVSKAIIESTELSIYQICRVAKGCLSYVITSNGVAAIIDPARNIQPYVDLLKKLNVKPQYILDTHAHADHISGGRELANQFGIPYYLHPYDGIHPMDMLPATFSYEASWANKIYPLGNINIEALHIPGHTLGNQAFLIDQRYLCSGDSIFIQSIARPDLGGQAKTWTLLHYESLKKLMALPDTILVLPGHFSGPQEANANHTYSKRLGDLKNENAGLLEAKKSAAVFSEYILSHLPHFPPEYIDIKRVNLGLLVVDNEKASELESGKNVCAVSH
jgi:glyoxylase-like metal-dependent hydrolase (beta-lactamase superfamily II)